MDSDSSADNQSDYEEQIEDVTEDERAKIRQEISTMSFEDLQKLKEEIGSRMYNKTIRGDDEKPKPRIFKRVNKNRPREMSSKIKPVIVKKAKPFRQNIKKQFNRDPRFDSKCGAFDKEEFRSNYKFIDDIKRDERVQLNKELNETQDPKRKKQIKLLMQRIDNQLRENEKLEEKQKKQQQETEEIKQKREEGKKPIFKKKSEKKVEELLEKYEELKKSNKLQKHIERRSKKLASKERKKLSFVKS